MLKCSENEILIDDEGRKFRKTNKRLGRGTFAEVFLGEWLKPDLQFVAIKQFFLSKQTLDKALETEIDIMRNMNHENIVQLISVISIRATNATNATNQNEQSETTKPNQVHEDRLWLILEYCDGGDFRT